VLEVTEGDAAVFGVVDGFGSWGSGVEAAEVVLSFLRQRWTNACPTTPLAVAREIVAAEAVIPREWMEGDMGCSFSVALVVHATGTTHVVAAGIFGVCRLDGREAEELFRPHRWVDEQMKLGRLSTQEALDHPLGGLPIGPFMADGSGRMPEIFGPFHVEAGSTLVIAEERILRALLAAPEGEWPATAAAIQELGTKHRAPGAPVVVGRYG
jgi:protein phosphatase